MNEREPARQRRQVERPIERAVAATDNENALVAERFHPAHRVMHGLAFIRLDAGDRRPLRLERSAARGNDHDLGFELLALIGLHPEQRIADLLHRLHHLAEMVLRIERPDLEQQRIDETLRAGHRKAGNVVYRLLRIKLRALAADLVEDVDQMRLHVEQAELEHREEADRPGADNENVGFDRFSHSVSMLVVDECR